MTARTGPLTKDATTVALGLAQIRVGLSSTYIGQIQPILPASSSIGTLANTKYTGSVDFYKLESGFPMMEDATFPLRESAMLECAFREITPANMALARGLNPADYSDAHYGTIPLGTLATPVYLRMEAVYTFPDGTNKLYVIFPRCQAVSSQELDFQGEEPAAIAISLEAKRADSQMTGGHVIWDGMPLGCFLWDDGSTLTTTTTTTTTTAP